MRPVILLFILILVVLFGSALLSVPLYNLLNSFFDIRFGKLVSHLASVLGLLFIFIYLKCYNMLDRDTAGFARKQTPLGRKFLQGVLIGIFIMVILELALLGLGIRRAASELGFNSASIIFVGKALFSGIAVGLIEETLYRGALLGGLVRKSGVLTAVVFSSLVYAAVHFIRFPSLAESAGSGWTAGFLILSDTFNRLLDPVIIDSFLSLTMFGIFLSLVRLQTGNIYQCIGIHAGVVMSIKIITKLTDHNRDSVMGFLVNSQDHHLGYLALVWLALLTVIYYRYGFKGRLSTPGVTR